MLEPRLNVPTYGKELLPEEWVSSTWVSRTPVGCGKDRYLGPCFSHYRREAKEIVGLALNLSQFKKSGVIDPHTGAGVFHGTPEFRILTKQGPPKKEVEKRDVERVWAAGSMAAIAAELQGGVERVNRLGAKMPTIPAGLSVGQNAWLSYLVFDSPLRSQYRWREDHQILYCSRSWAITGKEYLGLMMVPRMAFESGATGGNFLELLKCGVEPWWAFWFAPTMAFSENDKHGWQGMGTHHWPITKDWFTGRNMRGLKRVLEEDYLPRMPSETLDERYFRGHDMYSGRGQASDTMVNFMGEMPGFHEGPAGVSFEAEHMGWSYERWAASINKYVEVL